MSRATTSPAAALAALVTLAAGPSGAFAAPRPPAGGTARLSVAGAEVRADPRAASTIASLTISRAVYEPLYSIGEGGALEPVLARRAPELDGSTLVIPLRTDVVLHDGRTLTPTHVVASLERLTAPGSEAAHVLAGVRGALGASGTHVAGLRAGDGAVLVDLVEPSLELARLFASPRAAIRVASSGALRDEPFGASVGTGPWRVDRATRDDLHLAPFLTHHVGRPFLDAIVVETSAARAAARVDAELVLTPRRELSKTSPSLDVKVAARALVVLSTGSDAPELAGPRLAVMDGVFDRKILATRFLTDAEPARTLLGTLGDTRTSPVPLTLPKVQTTLLVSRADRALERAASRIQLELLRIGVSATIDRVTPEVLAARRASGRYGLMLDAVVPDPRGTTAIDLWASASSAAASARVLVEPAEVRELLRAPESERAGIVARLEREVRARAGLVVLATRAVKVATTRDLDGLTVEPSGALVLDDAHVARASAEVAP